MHRLKRTAERVLPCVLPYRLSATLLTIGDRYSQYRRFKRSHVPAATRIIEAELGLKVRNGPFQGMHYPRRSAYSRHAIPKLLGSYEQELHPAINRILADKTFRRYLDIGSAEGYYSAGFAFKTRSPVYAFEIDPFERRHTRLMARVNGVQDLLQLEGWCSPERIRRLCQDRSFILADCEGFEMELFTPYLAASLFHSDLIIELHLAKRAVISRFLASFSATHHIELMTSLPRFASDCPDLIRLGLADDQLVNEFRQPGQQWAVITAKHA